MLKNISFLLLLSFWGIACRNGGEIPPPDDCPFAPLTGKATYERTDASVQFCNELTIAANKLPKQIPLTVENVTELFMAISDISEAHVLEPIDTLLAGRYNVQRKKICGLFKTWERHPAGKMKDNFEILLYKAIADLFQIADAYKKNKLVRGDTAQGCKDGEAYIEKIVSYLDQQKGQAPSDAAREYWQSTINANRVWMRNCIEQPDCEDCFSRLLKKIRQLNFDS